MSAFVCAHGELMCKCKYCNIFDEKDDEKDLEEGEAYLSDLLRALKKEKVEY